MVFETILAIFLLLNLITSLLFVLKTKSKNSKMLITMLFNTTVVALLLLLFSKDMSNHQLLDVAFVFMVLSSITAIVFAKRTGYING